MMNAAPTDGDIGARGTQEYTLRAMGQNYEDGNLWDGLDREAVLKAADEIKNLRAALAAMSAKLAEAERGHAAARENFHTMQDAANKLRIRAETAEEKLATSERELEAERRERASLASSFLMQRAMIAQSDANLTTAEAANADLRLQADAMREALRSHWHGVFLDGRNEHGSHVLMLPQRSIDLEQDSNGDFLKAHAETILREAESAGFEIGDAVVATFDLCLDEGFFSHHEFVGISTDLTALLYGTSDEQSAARASGGSDG